MCRSCTGSVSLGVLLLRGPGSFRGLATGGVANEIVSQSARVIMGVERTVERCKCRALKLQGIGAIESANCKVWQL